MNTKDSSRGPRAFIWVTWITGLLAGTDKCEFAPWYKAHYRFAKLSKDGASLDDWKRQHDAMVTARVKALTAQGYAVAIEDQNAFKVKGTASDLSGKPDIVAGKGEFVLVIDEKSGQERQSDMWQVRIYLWALPIVVKQFARSLLAGEVEYRGKSIAVTYPNAEMVARIVSTLQLVGGELEPPRTPSVQECCFCDVAACPDRIVTVENVAETKVF